SPYPYNDPPVGCHWEAVQYDVNFSLTQNDPYVNVKLAGLDGEALRYRGIKYSQFTHDLNTSTPEGNWRNGYITFYPVPNGCTEYVLKFGDGNEDNGLLAAYYHIVNS
ncbi:MAG: hypothetical protein J5966_04055, partial [Lachnospiraceae bacterium]|nr:hypothetical protein [Lachnospiraceae bacterium]